MPPSSRLFSGSSWWLGLLAMLPPAVVVAYVARFYMALPFWDGWELVPDLQELRAGTLSLTDLWRPHNEHRLFLPRLILLGLASLTRWNHAYEVAANLAAAFAVTLLLVFQWRRTAAQIGLSQAGALLPLVSLFVFALTQWENWLWGWQFIFFLETLLSTAAVLLLANWQGRWPRLAWAALLGVLASLTLSLGLLIWPVGLLLLLLGGWANRARPAALAPPLLAWALAGLLVFALYFRGLAAPGLSLFALAVDQPLAYVHYVLNYLGSPVLTYDPAFIMGGLGLLAWIGCGLAMLRRYRSSPAALTALLPFLGLGLFALGGALLVGLSRLSFGFHQALASRYVTLSYPFWLSLSVLLYLLAVQPAAGWWGGWLRAAARLALPGLAALVLVCSLVGGLLGYHWRYLAVQPARLAARAGAPLADETLLALYPDPDRLRPWLEFLRSNRLSLFRDLP